VIRQLGNGLIRLTREPQFQFETSSPLLTLEISDYHTLDRIGLDEHGDMRLNPTNELFPYSVQVYPEQLAGHLSEMDWSAPDLVAQVDFSPSPKAYRWIRWYDQQGDSTFESHWGKYMVGHCLPGEVNKTRWLHCLLEDKFFVYPLGQIPRDFDDIWILEDEESEDEDA
jgi:hypothetical protein